MTDDKTKPWLEAIEGAEPKCTSLARELDLRLRWEAEKEYAIQAMMGNRKLRECQPRTISASLANVFTIGLSLNPKLQLAYLIARNHNMGDRDHPQWVKVCHLDISWRGLLNLATDTGSVIWAKAEIVCESDQFMAHGPAAAPTHNYDPMLEWGARGVWRGVYCIAKLHNGDILAEYMNREQVMKVRAHSAAKDSMMWTDFPEEGFKKSVIKRAYKSWPRTDQFARLDHAMATLNEHEGLVFDNRPSQAQALQEKIDRAALPPPSDDHAAPSMPLEQGEVVPAEPSDD